eukprot:54953-Eustigmatos_ZCMA.PRE.1
MARSEGQSLVGKAVLALADSSNAVAWVRKAGARDRRANALVRLVGMEEAEERFSSLSKHIAGVDNGVADFISRQTVDSVSRFMSDVKCPLRDVDVCWRQVQPPTTTIALVTSALLNITQRGR